MNLTNLYKFFIKFHDKYYWQVICLTLTILLIIYAVNFKVMVESATEIQCANIFYAKYYDAFGNLKFPNISSLNNSYLNFTLNITK